MNTTRNKLRSMNPTRALAYCANITSKEWAVMESEETIELWTVFRAYILNGYKDTGEPVPARISAVWGRCRAIIDKEAGK